LLEPILEEHAVDARFLIAAAAVSSFHAVPLFPLPCGFSLSFHSVAREARLAKKVVCREDRLR
jgi:hypothetical protein